MPEAATDLPTLALASQGEWRDWLVEHHANSPGVWLKIAKKGVDGISYLEALDVALCHGWIDGQKGGFDESFWVQRFTPRKPRSKWSQINCAKATALIASGAMQSAGMIEVERAKADGRWDAAYASQKSAAAPDDLVRALAENDRAREFFATLDSTNRYAIIYRIQDAKRPETRARRIDTFVAMCAAHEKVHP